MGKRSLLRKVVPLRPEELLLMDAAEMPVLSPGFRTRVLNAAIESQCRQSYGRRALWAAGVLVAALGLVAWHGPFSTTRDDMVNAGRSATRVIDVLEEPRTECPGFSQRYGTGELLLSAAGDDWRLVEAEIQSRREGSRRIRMN